MPYRVCEMRFKGEALDELLKSSIIFRTYKSPSIVSYILSMYARIGSVNGNSRLRHLMHCSRAQGCQPTSRSMVSNASWAPGTSHWCAPSSRCCCGR